MSARVKRRDVVPGMALCLLAVLVTACSGEGNDQAAESDNIAVVDAETDTDGPVVAPTDIGDEPTAVGQVHTTEIAGVVFSSLPDTRVALSDASVALGRNLFWDPVVSGDQDVACATCHLPEFGYADGRERSIGTGGVGTGPDRVPGQLGLAPRNAPTVINAVWTGINELGVFDPNTAPMFWDARTRGLVAQALEPILSDVEMRGNNFSEDQIFDEVISRLASNGDYLLMFEQAFGTTDITPDLIGRALADFQSSLVANNAPFDRWMRGDANAMSAQQVAGLQVFAETGCAECHSGPLFSDAETHVLGVPEADGLDTPDNGDGNFGFRTPTLRQLAFTAPYFHGGQENSLDDVIDFYDNPNGSDNPNVGNNQLDPDFLDLPNINNNESNAIEAFLDALNDDDFDRSRPASVPSGLPVGGSL